MSQHGKSMICLDRLHRSLCFRIGDIKIAGPSVFEYFPVDPSEQTVRPVSYTHLDVYKRQILVCVAVLMTYRAVSATGKIAALYLPILVFVLCGFEHGVANMY